MKKYEAIRGISGAWDLDPWKQSETRWRYKWILGIKEEYVKTSHVDYCSYKSWENGTGKTLKGGEASKENTSMGIER